jgi:Ca2+-binding RTX toxin-like protein
MATNTGNPFVDALAGQSPWTDAMNIGVYFEAGAAGNWTQQEITLFQNALTSWETVANVNFGLVQDIDDAELVERRENASTWPDSSPNADHNFPDPGGQSTGRYNTSKPAWNANDLVIGGNMYSTMVHELGHALGLDHPFQDVGQDSINFPGVNVSGDSGDNGLNNRIYSIMSYIRNNNGPEDNFGHVATPMAFDIAAIQQLYGANMNANAGDTTYELRDGNTIGTFYSCIWDVSGTDQIVYNGQLGTTIDLRPATLQNQIGGGGFISKVDFVFGGFTIAGDFTNRLTDVGTTRGVIIENAVGGSGSDILTGNDAANVLNGLGGTDTMSGGAGADSYYVDRVTDIINDITANNFVDDGSIDKVYATSSFSLMGTFAENLYIVSAFGDFSLTGNASKNILEGTGGNNTFRGNGGGESDVAGSGDIMRGGSGNDIYFANVQDIVIDFYGEGFDTIYATHFALGSAMEIEVLESLVKEGPGVNFVGNEVGTLFYGTTGYDTIDGGAGNDTIVGNFISLASTTGNLLRGGDGLDSIIGDDGEDVISGGADADTIEARNGNDFISGGSGGDAINGGQGTDMVTYEGSSLGVTAAMQQWSFTTNNIFTVSTVTAGYRNGDAQGDVLVDVENLEGSDLADTLVGNSGINTLIGGHGNDRLAGADGNDILHGEDESDRLEGGLGNDQLYGDISGSGPYGIPGDFAPGNDILYGQEGNDRLQGGQGADSLYGGDGNDVLIGNEFAGDLSDPFTFASDKGVALSPGLRLLGLDTADVDFLAGGAGNDIYYLGGKEDTISEGLNGGTDELRLALHDSSFDLSANGFENIENMTYLISFHRQITVPSIDNPLGYILFSGTADFVGTGNALNNRITGADMWDTLLGLGGNDILIGLAGVDRLEGGTGNDTLIGGIEGDTLIGGDDIDTVSYATSGVGVKAAFEAASVDNNLFFEFISAGFTGGDAAGDIVTEMENITGSGFADTLIGNLGVNTLNGGAGNDRLFGKDGADVLNGGADNDSLRGGTGADIMYGGSGNDTYEVDNVDDIVSEQSNILNFFFDDGGLDTVQSLLNTFALGNYIEKLTFTGIGNFIGTGNELDNTITGQGGGDTLAGGTGSDIIIGNAGQDTILLGNGLAGDFDTINGGGDRDFLDLSGLTNGGVWIDYGYNVISGANLASGFNLSMAVGEARVLQMESMVGTSFNDIMRGDAGSNLIDGGAGDDTLLSYSPYDTLTPYSSLGDVMLGGIGNDLLFSGTGNDYLDGGANNDTLEVGGGTDTVITGTGSDTIFFSPRNGTDTVTDFTGGAGVVDVLKLYGFGTSLDTFAEVFAVSSQVGADTQIALTDTTIILQNFTRTTLVADDFVFV